MEERTVKELKDQPPLISVIIPVFQVEKYLDKCISSVVNQSYCNLEIIIIDDGSYDKSPEICDKWKDKDSRITVVHKGNGGLSQARNVGLKLAKGNFIGFIDSDDWIESNMYEILMSAIWETGADIAVCDFQMEYEEKQSVKIEVKSPERKLCSNEDALRNIINGQSFISTAVWNKLYRKNVLLNSSFPEGKICEDTLWTATIVGNAKMLVCIESPLYHYLFRRNSLSRNIQQTARKLYDFIEMSEKRLEYIQKQYPALTKTAILRLQNFCLREYIKISLKYGYLDEDYEIRRKLHQHFCQFRPSIILNIDNIWKNCVRILFYVCPKILAKTYINYNMMKSK